MTRWRSGAAAVAVTVATLALVVLDLVDDDVRAWWAAHALTTSTVSGLLVLAVTVLVVDQVTDLRRARDRSRSIAAQVAIVLGQAERAGRSVTSALGGSGTRDDATDAVRSYLVILLVSAPLLIDTPTSRAFLEQAQRLGVRMGRLDGGAGSTVSAEQVGEAVGRVREAADPLLAVLHPAERAAATGDDA